MIIIILVWFAIAEKVNYDYLDHGDNWPGTCKNGSNQAPLLLHKSSPQHSYFIPKYANTNLTLSIFNTTLVLSNLSTISQAYTLTSNNLAYFFKLD